ncbi:hypothetical protein COHA_000338 [Chlorella ohadii]|uniref:Uncharacterized protein n=1 Tax=Chlorella ohadii TaxID=2649997 RepID=A0AAD5H951_9CHLO|nr:hypothetical protein COHA_000338 [Chlorella ohadii]
MGTRTVGARPSDLIQQASLAENRTEEEWKLLKQRRVVVDVVVPFASTNAANLPLGDAEVFEFVRRDGVGDLGCDCAIHGVYDRMLSSTYVLKKKGGLLQAETATDTAGRVKKPVYSILFEYGGRLHEWVDMQKVVGAMQKPPDEPSTVATIEGAKNWVLYYPGMAVFSTPGGEIITMLEAVDYVIEGSKVTKEELAHKFPDTLGHAFQLRDVGMTLRLFRRQRNKGLTSEMRGRHADLMAKKIKWQLKDNPLRRVLRRAYLVAPKELVEVLRAVEAALDENFMAQVTYQHALWEAFEVSCTTVFRLLSSVPLDPHAHGELSHLFPRGGVLDLAQAALDAPDAATFLARLKDLIMHLCTVLSPLSHAASVLGLVNKFLTCISLLAVLRDGWPAADCKLKIGANWVEVSEELRMALSAIPIEVALAAFRRHSAGVASPLERALLLVLADDFLELASRYLAEPPAGAAVLAALHVALCMEAKLVEKQEALGRHVSQLGLTFCGGGEADALQQQVESARAKGIEVPEGLLTALAEVPDSVRPQTVCASLMEPLEPLRQVTNWFAPPQPEAAGGSSTAGGASGSRAAAGQPPAGPPGAFAALANVPHSAWAAAQARQRQGGKQSVAKGLKALAAKRLRSSTNLAQLSLEDSAEAVATAPAAGAAAAGEPEAAVEEATEAAAPAAAAPAAAGQLLSAAVPGVGGGGVGKGGRQARRLGGGQARFAARSAQFGPQPQ